MGSGGIDLLYEMKYTSNLNRKLTDNITKGSKMKITVESYTKTEKEIEISLPAHFETNDGYGDGHYSTYYTRIDGQGGIITIREGCNGETEITMSKTSDIVTEIKEYIEDSDSTISEAEFYRRLDLAITALLNLSSFQQRQMRRFK